MTGVYGAGDGVPGRGGDETAAPGTDRPGPLPPRIVPPTGHATVPGQPAGHPAAPTPGLPGAPADGFPPAGATTGPGAAYGSPTATPGAGFGSAPAAFGAAPAASGSVPGGFGAAPGAPGASQPGAGVTWSAAPNSGQWGGPTAPTPRTPGGWPPAQPGAVPGQFAGQPGVAAQPAPASGPAYPGQPTSGPAYPGQAAGGTLPVPPAGHPERSGRGRRLPVVALVLAGILALVAGLQAYQIHRLDDRLAATDRRLAEAQGATAGRLDGLEERAGVLEKQAGAAFNPEAVASAVLPSVFRVRAGQFTGTAFAIGKAPSGGGTTLLTNFHVVEAVFTAGDRKVFLERTDQRFEATIVEVDKDKDLAHLRTTAKFTGLVAARTPVKSGQQIVVVGAPLGLQDSVTTGVVSAFRKDEGGSGPVIQFDAPINPGNSGGPVINGSKEVVGIATAKARDAEGIGLAVPIKTACDRFKLC
ncbi:trypsin-like peptidase domain-containing protein [Micromonospora sp. MA102]|uniref:trypsin-like peptidase domain-containing protein n=1 Tax=Micromonospora sp. MA102 TaxID=2952755 RepID=UPI0021C9DCBD|nr:trypsin-like peptidase domain-containing protein [Micromonospora sp. MA102]